MIRRISIRCVTGLARRPVARAAVRAALARGFESSSTPDGLDAMFGPGGPSVPREYMSDPFRGIAEEPFAAEIASVLMEPINPDIVQCKPDGIVYLPEIMYRRILNKAFGPGGWALMPRTNPYVENKVFSQEWALYCMGRFVAQARGEQTLFSGGMSLASAQESARSSALSRCCKDLGIASDLWDQRFIRKWKEDFAVGVWCEHQSSGQKKLLWRRKDAPPIAYPWQESGGSGTKTSSYSRPSPSMEVDWPEEVIPEITPDSFDPLPDGAPVDLESEVPHSFAKFRGSTWGQMLEEPASRQYLKWMSTRGGQHSPLCAKLLDYYESSR